MRWPLSFLVTLISMTSVASPNAYMITAQIFMNDKFISSPRVVTLAGEPAEISQVSEKPHSDELQKFRMKVVATEVSNETITDGLLMKFEIESVTDAHTYKATPQVLTKLGSEATISIGDSTTNKEKVLIKVFATRQ